MTGGTINLTGSFDFVVTAYQNESRLSKIVEMVTAALGSKPQIQRLVDRVAAVFVPIVIVLAIVTLVVWLLAGAAFSFALKNTIAILIIACPCALGLATPMAIMVAVGRAASLGILFKGSESLEQVGKVRILYFDKTGTLTEGKFQVGKIMPLEMTEDRFLYYVSSVEKRSEHLLAKTVVAYVRDRGITLSDVEDFTSLAGAGASGRVDGRNVLIGTRMLMEARGVEVTPLLGRYNEQVGSGNTVIFAALESKLIGMISFSDIIKTEARKTIDAVKSLGVITAIITGDNRAVAEQVARTLGISDVEAELLPQQKLNRINARKESGEIVGMVGDGINDAPALATADVGIALASGTEVAIEAAAVTLTGNGLHKIPTAIRLARATVRNIKQNLFWAFFYNVAAIPVAAGLFYPVFKIQLAPAIAALAMSLSSIFVVTNALRLKRFG